MVIGIADAKEYDWLSGASENWGNYSKGDSGASQDPSLDPSDLKEAINDLREQFPRVYLHSLLVFDCSCSSLHPSLPEETILVPPVAQLKTTTMKTYMCDLTAILLAEMTTLARSLQGLPTIQSPTTPHGGISDSSSNWTTSDSIGGQAVRRNSQTPGDSRSASPATGAQSSHYRMSMPAQLPSTSSTAASIQDESRSASPATTGTRTPPATTFDEIPGVNSSNALTRTNSSTFKSNTSIARDPNLDRVSVHGFGSGGVSERARNKGRGRVGIVIGTLYMCAGRWQDAIRELVESAMRARTASDHLWHAKGLENIMVCLLLFAWSGMDFQVRNLEVFYSSKIFLAFELWL